MSQTDPATANQPAEAAPSTKRTNRYLIPAIVAAGLAVLGLATAVLNLPAEDPAPATSLKTHTVIYKADGAGTAGGKITLRSADGGTQQADVALPMKTKAGEVGLTYPGFRSGDFVYLSVQNANGGGSVSCEIVVDGVTISSNTSVGAYVIASCSSRVP